MPAFPDFSPLRITVLGDIMLDHYIFGDTHRISPEAPVPVVEVAREHHTAGGAANVALNLASLGVQTTLCGACGDDASGHQLRDILARRNVDLDSVFLLANLPTIIKTRIVVQRQQLCRLDRELEPKHYGLSTSELVEKVAACIENSDAVLLSDYAKGVLTQELVDRIDPAVKRRGALVGWDPKPKHALRPPTVDFMTPNRIEALQLAGLDDLHPQAQFPADEVGSRIFERYHPRYLVVTLGPDGMLLYKAPTDHTHLPTAAREVFDVSGAGDTVVAVLAAGLASGMPLVEAGRLANAAASVVVAKLGTATVTRQELEKAIAQ